MKLLENILDFVFPNTSLISDERIDDYNTIDYVLDSEFEALSRVSGKDLEDLQEKLISDYSYSFIAFYENDNFSNLIYHLKYGGMKNLGIFLGEILGKELINHSSKYEIKLNEFDLIIPIPLYKTKLRERGYNQSDYICKGLNNILKIEYKTDIIKRVRHTKSQTKLSRKRRIENVKDAFVFNEKYYEELKGKKVLVIDDVVTTGSTINEAVKIIKENTESEVMACTVAMARD